MLEIKNLNKSFGNFRALQDLSMTVGKGELFGFVGANGAGKTTTMKICVGLEYADSGSIILDGQEMMKKGACHPKIGQIGYVPDFFGVYDNLTTIEYLTFFAATYGIWGKKSDALCESLLELVNLSDKRDFQVDSLSRGMKQRLCVARALVHNPDILFLDEPASGLDPKARHELREILKNLTEMGKTVIISSHILPELIEMCSSIGIISHGQMRFNGSIEDAIRLSKGGVRIEVMLNDKLEEATRIITEFPQISNLESVPGKVIFQSCGNDLENGEILKKLILSDVPVLTFTKKQENVEDIFLNIMEGGDTSADANA